jgi:hypothetical protein
VLSGLKPSAVAGHRATALCWVMRAAVLASRASTL